MASEFQNITSTRELNEFIQRELHCDEEYSLDLRKDMDFLAQHLREKSDFVISETLKSGSTAKGTAVKGNADLDVVLFTPKYKTLAEMASKLQEDIDDLADEIKEWASRKPSQVKYKEKTSHAVQLCVRSSGPGHMWTPVDLLPAYYLLERDNKQGGKQRRNKKGLEQIRLEDSQYASVCLAPLQIEFVKAQQSNVKDLIRLVKFWNNVTDFQGTIKRKKKFPTSYVYELLTIHAWEKADKPHTFDIVKGFMAVMKILKDFQHIDASWNTNYIKSDFHNAAQKVYYGEDPNGLHNAPHRPYILDPASPYNNVCERFDGWQQVADKAHELLHYAFFRSVKLCRRPHSKHKGSHLYDWS